MLVFLAHWCPHCNREVPELNKWRDSGDVPEGLQVVAVTTAVSADREHYPPSTWIRDEMGWTWPVLADSPDNDAAIAFGVSGFPFSVILDTDGTVLGRSSGELGLDGIEAFVADSLAKAS
jgi:thiol-disulfide isomerase/thioredoxin